MIENLNIELVTELLEVGTLGFVGGVIIPLAFRLVGYVVDSVKLVLLKED